LVTFHIMGADGEAAERCYESFSELGSEAEVIETRLKAAEIMFEYHQTFGDRRAMAAFKREIRELRAGMSSKTTDGNERRRAKRRRRWAWRRSVSPR
jgi:hypothetical protein